MGGKERRKESEKKERRRNKEVNDKISHSLCYTTSAVNTAS
jgi:hypothetical protein